MAKDNWTNSSGGDFAIGTNWRAGVPGSSTIANINAAGAGTYMVTSSATETVLAITTIPTATLYLSGNGQFTALAGTGPARLATAGVNVVQELDARHHRSQALQQSLSGPRRILDQPLQNEHCPSSNGLGQSELFRDGGSGSFGLEFRRLSTDVAIVAV